jgi:hypothetical protein
MGTQIKYGYGFTSNDNYGDDKYYCWTHKKLVVSAYKKAKLDKIKQENKQLKLKEKEELKKTKDEAKQKEKEEKQKMKETLKKKKLNIDENIIIGVSSVATESVGESVESVKEGNQILLCQEILKSGNNKGSLCGNKIFENNVCKRHLNKTK